MKFKSKIDWWFYFIVILFVALPIYFLYLSITDKVFNFELVALFASIDSLLILSIALNTNYTFGNTKLNIKSGLGSGSEIPYTDITSYKETHNPLASSALSLDRIEISYKNGVVLVSPIYADHSNKTQLLQMRLCVFVYVSNCVADYLYYLCRGELCPPE